MENHFSCVAHPSPPKKWWKIEAMNFFLVIHADSVSINGNMSVMEALPVSTCPNSHGCTENHACLSMLWLPLYICLQGMRGYVHYMVYMHHHTMMHTDVCMHIIACNIECILHVHVMYMLGFIHKICMFVNSAGIMIMVMDAVYMHTIHAYIESDALYGNANFL